MPAPAAAASRIRPAHVIALVLLIVAIVIGSIGGRETDATPTLVEPPGWAFSIWSLIFAGWLAFGIVQLLPSWCDRAWVRAGRWPLVVGAVLAGSWINIVDEVPWPVDMFIYAVTLGAAILAAWRTASAWSDGPIAAAIASVGASLFAGWVTVATAVSIAIAIRDEGWSDITGADGRSLAIMLVAGTVVFAGIVAMFMPRPLGYGAAVAWGLTAIATDRWSNHESLTLTCLAGAALVLAIAAARTFAGARTTAIAPPGTTSRAPR